MSQNTPDEEYHAQNARLTRALGERTYTKSEVIALIDAALIEELETMQQISFEHYEEPGEIQSITLDEYLEDRITELQARYTADTTGSLGAAR